MFHFFPEEIWENILKRLPSKSLCRFLCVSKPWCRLITSPDFISANLNHNLTTEISNYILVHVSRNHENLTETNPDDWVQEFLFYSHHQIMNIGVDGSLSEPSFNNKLPFQSDEKFRRVLSCNGLICIEGHLDTIILWNPTISKFVKLPPFSNFDPSHDLEGRQAIGFGVNLLDGDFKVIRIVMENDDNEVLVDVVPIPPPLVEVFSLRRGTWAEVSEVSFNPISFWTSHIYLNGHSHWVCNLVGEEEDQPCSLVSFDLSNEIFGELLWPQQLELGPYYLPKINLITMTLMEMECLAITTFDENNASFGIWVMKEYRLVESWSNIYTIDLEFIRPFNIGKLIVTNGNILMMVLGLGWPDRTKLTCYDLATKLVSEFDISCQGLHKYMETLALLEPRISI